MTNAFAILGTKVFEGSLSGRFLQGQAIKAALATAVVRDGMPAQDAGRVLEVARELDPSYEANPFNDASRYALACARGKSSNREWQHFDKFKSAKAALMRELRSEAQ
jgi:hypothetical protein